MIPFSKYFFFAAVLPFLTTIVAGTVLTATHDDGDYTSEWSTDDGFGFTVLIIIVLSFFISICSLPLYFNMQESVRKSSLASFSAWIFLPGIVCLYVMIDGVQNLAAGQYDADIADVSRLLNGYVLGVTILHLSGLCITYLHFRRKLKSGGWPAQQPDPETK